MIYKTLAFVINVEIFPSPSNLSLADETWRSLVKELYPHLGRLSAGGARTVIKEEISDKH
ncbi:MAG: hypothetical protein J7M18_07135 [Candidatus Eremiobacteraeota bacterium]|nr:hypothetical protein [Candidatus Eremiobacteraeota bacterium]